MAILTLEDGTRFEGESFGAAADVIGEVVFNTGMTGYQEVLDDASYCGQIVAMTYPLIGNYGITNGNYERAKPRAAGFIAREVCARPSNWRSEGDIGKYLADNNICGLSGIDTRALTRVIREKGTMKGIITQKEPTQKQLDDMRKFELKCPVDIVTCKQLYEYCAGSPKIAVIDLGLKRCILHSLKKRGCGVTVFPARADANEILSGGFDGFLISNGPGNPKDNKQVIGNLKLLVNKKPILGICLGHLVLALVMGADTEKLKYGHRGANHPVKDLKRDRVYITSQNHGYAVMESSVPEGAQIIFRNWNDGTIEGLSYENAAIVSVQFYPEAAPGPEDTAHIYDEFIDKLRS